MSKPSEVTEVEQHWTRVVKQGEHARRTVRGVQIEVGHASSEQRVSLSEVVVDVESGDHRGDALAWLVHGQQLHHGVVESPVAFVGDRERDLRHGVVLDPRADRMSFRVVRVEQAFW